MSLKFGIDFGTTNSACIAILEGRKEIKIGDGYGNPFPSLVAVDRLTGRDVYCGREVWERRQELNEICKIFSSIKTILGTSWEDRIQNVAWIPEMVAAEIFKGIKFQAKEIANINEMGHAVVAVPVGFSSEKRKGLRKAAQAAGITIESFISEPTAALFCHLDEVGSYSRIGVIDWGGGTLDVSIIEVRHHDNGNKIVKELGVGGLNIGGDNIDLRIAEWAHDQIINKKGVNIAFSEMPASARDQLIARCERAKQNLAFNEITEIRINKYGDLGTIKIAIDVDILTSLTTSFISQAIKCFEDTLKRTHLSIEDLGCILMVGGSVKLDPFKTAADLRWPCVKYYPDESDWSVARGAALLALNSGKYCIAEDIGIVMSDDSFFPFFQAGEIVDERKKHFKFGLVEDTDTACLILADAQGNTLGHLDVPAFGFFQEPISLETYIDENLILRVDAKSSNHGNEYLRTWLYSGVVLDYELPV